MSAKALRDVAEIMKEFGLTEARVGDIYAKMAEEEEPLSEEAVKLFETLNNTPSDEELMFDPYVGLPNPEMPKGDLDE